MAGGPSLIYEFVSEAKEHLANVNDDLLALEQRRDDTVRYRVDRLFRAVHSVKGGAGFFGCRRVEELAHAMETVLDRSRQAADPPTPEVIDALLVAADRIQAMLDDVDRSNQADIGDALARLKPFLNEALPSEAPLFVLPGPALEERPTDQPYLYGLTIDLLECHQRQALTPPAVLDALLKTGTLVNGRLVVPEGDLSLPLSARGLLYQALLSSALPPDQLQGSLGLASVQVSLLEAPAQPAVSAAEPGQARPPERSDSVRIPVGLLDRLMTLAGELVLVRNRALGSQEGRDPTFRPVLQRLDVVTSDIQDAVMRTRMQPVATLFGRFPRMVRDLARQLGKHIEMNLAGTEVELDKTILENLADPLTHLIRNACDHGLETPERRRLTGKPEVGQITLAARHLGGQIYLEVRDDGKGIDLDAVKRKAVQQSLRTPNELSRMSDKEVLSLILLPGFSTAATLTDVSGRGVGMDVVKTNLDRMGGAMEIESILGRGTTFTLRLPLTLAIIPCLLVTFGGERYAVPQKDLEELAYLQPEQVLSRVEVAHDQEVLRWRKRLLPLVRLEEVFAHRKPLSAADRAESIRAARANPPRAVYLAVVKVGAQRFGLLVDQILATEEIVVKPMHSALKPLGCFSGATIMGDGRVALILSVEGVARHAGVQYEAEVETPRPAGSRSSSEAQTVLLFRSGLQEQFALPLGMVRRIVLIDTRRIEKIGQEEFITLDGTSTPLVRLDRFLNVSPCQEREKLFVILPRNLRRPLGILASEIVDTEARELRLDSDAYRPDGLLGSAVLRGQMTLFVDVYRLADRLETVPPRPALPAPAGRQRRILLVEDTQFFQQLVKGYLEGQGYEVVVASHGQEGLGRLEQEPFDLVISDLEMPVMDGWSLARAVRQRPGGQRTRLMALTTLSGEQESARALESGFDRHEVKLDRERFLAAVAEMLSA